MSFVSVPEVQQWLEATRLSLAFVDVEFERTANAIVFGSLSDMFDQTAWVDETTTPVLVRKIMSMFIAAWTYRKAYGEDGGESEYADDLESSAYKLLGGLAEGSINLPVDQIRTSYGRPSFWPTDSATLIAEEEGPEADGAAMRAFTMGRVF